jgi:hypothetical protein
LQTVSSARCSSPFIIAASLAASKEIPINERLRLKVRLDNARSFGTNSGGGESGTGTAGYGGTPVLNLTLACKW